MCDILNRMRRLISPLVLVIFCQTARLCLATDSDCSMTTGRSVYENNCLSCHGADGKGDGPELGTIALPPELRARDFTTGHFKVADCDVDIKNVIRHGGAPYGLNPLMSSHSTLTEEQLDCVIGYIRQFAH